MTNKKTPVGILGAGISGLSTAHALARKGIESTVYEKADSVGGAIRSAQTGDWLVEEGPNTILIKTRSLWDLIENLGLKKHVLEVNEEAPKRYVVKDSTPVALPSSITKIVTTPLLSAGAKLRLLKEPFVPASVKHDESIASFFRRRLGDQPLDYGVNPFVSGIYAGDPEELSVKHTFQTLWEMEQQYGSVAKGLFKRNRPNSSAKRALISFEEGNQMLPKALAKALPGTIQTSATITAVKKRRTQWLIKGERSGTTFEQTHDCVISTLPTYCLPDIFESEHFTKLGDLPYAPLSVLALGFKDGQIGHPLDGFGMLIPEIENYQTLGVLFSSALFPGRAPGGHHLLTCFIGGARNPELAGKPKAKLQTIVLEELEELLGIDGSPVFTHHRFWPQAIPQYRVGYDYYLSLINEIETEFQGLYLEGNYRNGVSVPDCISSGFETAQKAYAFLQSVS